MIRFNGYLYDQCESSRKLCLGRPILYTCVSCCLMHIRVARARVPGRTSTLVRGVTAWFLEVRVGGTCRAVMTTSGGPRGTSTLVSSSGGSTSAVIATPRGLLFGDNAQGTSTSTTTGLDWRVARRSPPSTRRRGRGPWRTTTFQLSHLRGH